jgi:tetratricopeptide (TPR) repeat protein
MYALQGDQGRADETFQIAMEKNPASSWAWRVIGKIYAAMGSYDGVVGDFDLGLEESEEDDEYRGQLAAKIDDICEYRDLKSSDRRYDALLQRGPSNLSLKRKFSWKRPSLLNPTPMPFDWGLRNYH